MSRRSVATLLAAAMPVALGLTLAAPQAAFAGETVGLTTDGKTPDTAGHVKTQVTVAFPSRRAYDVKGWVSDQCPGDGFGAYVYIERVISGPDGGHFLDRRRVGADANGCGNGRVRFDPGPRKYSTKLTQIRIMLCEWDGDGNSGSYSNCTWKYVSNWRTS